MTVDMGPARLDWRDIPLAGPADTLRLDVAEGPWSGPVAVSMGNPHIVFFVDDVDAVPLEQVGPILEHHPAFPQRANIEFVQVLSRTQVRMRVWERSAGITRACGSGACAVQVAACRRGLVERRAEVMLDGGSLTIEWRDDGHVLMTGAGGAQLHGRAATGSRSGLIRRSPLGDGMSTEFITFGCRLNAYESEVMREHAAAAGLTDAVIVNTCAVTAEAERQARQAIRKARRENPDARIIVTGCAAQIDPAKFAAHAGSRPGARQRGEAEAGELRRSTRRPERVLVNDIMSVKETAGHLIDGLEGRARAFVQVQNGCDHRCTFCIIPYGRGQFALRRRSARSSRRSAPLVAARL